MRGLHQARLIPVKQAELIKIGNKWTWKPPVMKRKDFYMCMDCFEKGKKWPGKKY
jgi:hypothetical protein